MAAGFELPGVIELEDDTGSDIHDFPGTTSEIPGIDRYRVGPTKISVSCEPPSWGRPVYRTVTCPESAPKSTTPSPVPVTCPAPGTRMTRLRWRSAVLAARVLRAEVSTTAPELPVADVVGFPAVPDQSDHKGDDGGKRDAGADQDTPPPGSPCLPPSLAGKMVSPSSVRSPAATVSVGDEDHNTDH